MKRVKRISVLILSIFFIAAAYCQNGPSQVAVIGLTHTHVHWIFGSEKNKDIKVVAIVEKNRKLAQEYADQYGFSMDIVYETMDEMFEENRYIHGVCAFGPIYDHLKVVEKAAPLGIDVMVEKPLAVSLEHAIKMKELAEEHEIELLTNYETTWYPSNHKAMELVKEGKVGEIRKVVIHDGHRGPKKIGVNEEFLEWLIDPELNGGGAITDFGCYGANLMTWLMNGEKPISVTAVTQQMQKENNPKVDDDAIIILQYEKANAIIQASWDWPIGRKDMEIYGLIGVLYSDNRNDLRVRIAEGYDGFAEEIFKLEERKWPYNDPFSLFSAVIKKEAHVRAFDLSSLENNMIVMEILDAAIQSAKTGKTVKLSN